MKRLGLGFLALIALGLIVALCFGVLDDDETEIEVEEVGVAELWRAAA